MWIWFTDGHLLPYTGKEKVHYSYNTQRRMPVPGRTHTITHISAGSESTRAGHAEPYLLKSGPITTDGAKTDGRGDTEQAMRAVVR
jgi:hypothetical protein